MKEMQKGNYLQDIGCVGTRIEMLNARSDFTIDPEEARAKAASRKVGHVMVNGQQ